jgi:coenzyme F420-reducing hydrogenase delta subunit
MVFGCRDDAAWRRAKRRLQNPDTAAVDTICVGQLPPSYLDFVLSRGLADGIVLAGCPGGNCQYRLGAEWTALRLGRERDPRLRKRVDTSRLALAWDARWPGHRGTAAVVDALRRSLAPNPASPAAAAPGRSRSAALRWLLAALAYTAFLAPVAVFSVWPRFALIDAGEAMISLSFSHAGARVGECRQLSQEELQKLPPNMRKPSDCPRERLPLRVSFRMDGEPLYQATLAPTGLWNDGAAKVYERLTIPAGRHTLFVGLNERGEPEGWHYALEQAVDLIPGQHVVVEFDSTRQAFRYRLE